jgi:predicted nucleic acid-binding protein
MGNDTMKEEYDFSKGERGKFFQKDIKLNLPVYLEGEIMEFVEKIAKKKNVDVSTIVNQLLRRDMQLSDVMQ